MVLIRYIAESSAVDVTNKNSAMFGETALNYVAFVV